MVHKQQGCKMPDTVPLDKMKAWLGKPCMPAEPRYDAGQDPEDIQKFEKGCET